MEFDVLIEIPRGQQEQVRGRPRVRSHAPRPHAVHLDPVPGRLRLRRGDTLGEDGDPARRPGAAATAIPLFPGVLVRCRAIGMFRMTDEKGGDDKLLTVPVSDPRLEHLRDIHHVPEFDRLEIQHFFEVYKELEPGKSVEGANWVGPQPRPRSRDRPVLQAGRQRSPRTDRCLLQLH